jgi:hypothetical protein
MGDIFGTMAAGMSDEDYLRMWGELVANGRIDPVRHIGRFGREDGVFLLPRPLAGGRAATVKPIERAPQERSGIFDYSFKMPHRESGVVRYDPPRGVPQRTQDLLSRQDVFDKMVEGTVSGLKFRDWYDIGPVYKSFLDKFSKEEGSRRFDAFVDGIASASPRSDFGTSLRNGSYYYGQANPEKYEGGPGAGGQPRFVDLPETPPYPYGHLAQKLHRRNVKKTLYADGPGFDPKRNAKPLSMAWNLKGDLNLVTVDSNAFRAPAMLGRDPAFLATPPYLSRKADNPRNIQKEFLDGKITMDDLVNWGPGWQSKPRENEYGAFEQYYRKIANELGIAPAEAQPGSWFGHGLMTGLRTAPKHAMDFFEEHVLKTARERNMNPIDVWLDAITGRRPLTYADPKIIGDMPGFSQAG